MLLDLTDVSEGNALGIGFADFIPASLANKLDFQKTYINCFTAGPAGTAPQRGCRWCCHDEEACIKAALDDVRSRGRTEPSTGGPEFGRRCTSRSAG